MIWLLAWWRALTGRSPDLSAAREHPEIRETRDRQHDQLNRLAALELEQEMFRRRQAEGGQAR